MAANVGAAGIAMVTEMTNSSLVNGTNTNGTGEERDGSGAGVATLATTLLFCVGVVLTNGGLLLIFLIKRNTRKHLTIVQASNMINCFSGSLIDLLLRIPLYLLSPDRIMSISPSLCHVMRLVPNALMMAIVICLPLLTGERLLLLLKQKWTPSRIRNVVVALLVLAYSVTLTISLMPLTNIFGANDKVNAQCGGTLKYSYVSFAFTYSAITGLSVLSTLVFSVLTVVALKVNLKHRKSKTKRRILKHSVVAAIMLTFLLGFGTMPFALSFSLLLTCGGNYLTDERFCSHTLPKIIFRSSIIIQKIAYFLLPIVLLRLNPAMRRKIWLELRRPKEAGNNITLSSTAASSSEDRGDGEQTPARANMVDVQVRSTRFLKREQLRPKLRQNLMETVDVMSVISEASESHASSQSNDKCSNTNSRRVTFIAEEEATPAAASNGENSKT